MKSNIFTVAGKEFYRFFRDKRMIISLVLPALILYVTYSFLMPMLMTSMTKGDKPTTLYVINLPDALKDAVSALDCTLIEGTDADTQSDMQALQKDENTLLLSFPLNFDALVADYSTATQTNAPNVELYYNSVSTPAATLYGNIVQMLDTYESAMSNKFDINRDIKADLASEQDVTAMLFSQVMPILLMLFLFTGCMSFAPDSISGEKERGTLATMLVTPINRYEIVVGKVIAFGVIAVINGGLTFAAVALSLPNLVGMAEMGMSFTGYSAPDYFYLFLVIITTVLLMISVVSLISAYAKTTKEAMSLVSPLMIVIIFVAMSGMQGGGKPAADTVLYAIPFYNSVQSMIGIFAYNYSQLDILLGALCNGVYSVIVVLLVTKMFHNERIMFTS